MEKLIIFCQHKIFRFIKSLYFGDVTTWTLIFEGKLKLIGAEDCFMVNKADMVYVVGLDNIANTENDMIVRNQLLLL